MKGKLKRNKKILRRAKHEPSAHRRNAPQVVECDVFYLQHIITLPYLIGKKPGLWYIPASNPRRLFWPEGTKMPKVASKKLLPQLRQNTLCWS
jgi:hypothetical protein